MITGNFANLHLARDDFLPAEIRLQARETADASGREGVLISPRRDPAHSRVRRGSRPASAPRIRWVTSDINCRFERIADGRLSAKEPSESISRGAQIAPSFGEPMGATGLQHVVPAPARHVGQKARDLPYRP